MESNGKVKELKTTGDLIDFCDLPPVKISSSLGKILIMGIELKMMGGEGPLGNGFSVAEEVVRTYFEPEAVRIHGGVEGKEEFLRQQKNIPFFKNGGVLGILRTQNMRVLKM